jgi:hypothetical protein
MSIGTAPPPAASPALATLQVALGVLLLLAVDALLIIVARLLDPGAPVILLSNLVAVFIGGLQLLIGVPLALFLRRRRPALAAGIALGMALVLILNTIALFD